jgi:hypothetical protein
MTVANEMAALTPEERKAVLEEVARMGRTSQASAAAVAAFRQLEAERIAAGEPEPDPTDYVEILARQRRWFAAQRRSARDRVLMSGRLKSDTDFETQVEMEYVRTASAQFFSADKTFEGGPIANVEDLCARITAAETTDSEQDKTIRDLRQQIAAAKEELFLLAGRSKK